MTLDQFREIADLYGATVCRSDNCAPNSAACAGNDIYLGEFSDVDIEIIAFFHEIGHILTGRRGYALSTISKEGAAWEVGLNEAARHGHIYEYSSRPCIWARKQLRTYMRQWIPELGGDDGE